MYKADPSMSPILLWEKVVRKSRYIDSSIIVCRTMDCEHYRSLIASEHINTLNVIALSEIEEPHHRCKTWGLCFFLNMQQIAGRESPSQPEDYYL